jgi:hypothetical protein
VSIRHLSDVEAVEASQRVIIPASAVFVHLQFEERLVAISSWKKVMRKASGPQLKFVR